MRMCPSATSCSSGVAQEGTPGLAWLCGCHCEPLSLVPAREGSGGRAAPAPSPPVPCGDPFGDTQASMIPGSGPVVQALLGTFLTWGLTAAGSALVFVFSSGQRRILDGSLGFAAGVMLAASYWSLLAPAIEMAEESGTFGAFSFFPVAAGFALGAAFVYGADLLIPVLGFTGPSHAALALSCDQRAVKEKQEQMPGWDVGSELSIRIGRAGLHPEGLAVGVGFGAIGKSASATFQSARNLAIGIGIQNFPEGLAVSLPLRGAGFSTWKAFWYGQLSGMVEPLAGVFGAFAVVLAEPLLPYALGFAAGAMVYVVMDDIIPEAQTSGNGKLASWTSILGFVVMMSLDVGLG
ncbi:zinc transporter ZIP11 isoform X4 [Aphelocoma coerulescens]|uniref:zinc transporter ZIP11 isoform X4 n=1 Tax=Aphelocoma coerulescens TaxID=39617 RepID=UPI0036047764